MISESFAQVLILKENFPFAFRSERLKTFDGFHHFFPVPVEKLADNGFYFQPTNEHADLTICFYCQGKLSLWCEEDCVEDEHKRWFPACPVYGKDWLANYL